MDENAVKDLIERLRLGTGTSPDHLLMLEAANALERSIVDLPAEIELFRADRNRYRWLRSLTDEICFVHDPTFDATTQKPAASFRYIRTIRNRREWDTASKSEERIDAAIDALIGSVSHE